VRSIVAAIAACVVLPLSLWTGLWGVIILGNWNGEHVEGLLILLGQVALSTWSVVSAVGLLRRRPWARASFVASTIGVALLWCIPLGAHVPVVAGLLLAAWAGGRAPREVRSRA
jgi:hypothetical protein